MLHLSDEILKMFVHGLKKHKALPLYWAPLISYYTGNAKYF